MADLQDRVNKLEDLVQRQSKLLAQTGQKLIELQVEAQKQKLGKTDSQVPETNSKSKFELEESEIITSEDICTLVGELQGQLEIIEKRSIIRSKNVLNGDKTLIKLPDNDGNLPLEFPENNHQFNECWSKHQMLELCKFYELVSDGTSSIVNELDSSRPEQANLIQHLKNELKGEHLKNEVKDEHLKNELKGEHLKNEIKGEHLKNEVKGEHLKNEVKGQHLKNELKDQHLKNEVKGEHLKNEIRAEHLKNEVKGEHLKNEVKGEHLKNEIKGEHLKNEVKGEHLKNEIKGEHLKNEVKGEHLKNEIKGEHLKNEVKGEHLKNEIKGEHLKNEVKGEHLKNEIKGEHLKNDVKGLEQLRGEIQRLTLKQEQQLIKAEEAISEEELKNLLGDFCGISVNLS